VSTPETTADQLQTTPEAPEKAKTPTAKEVRAKLADLEPVAAARMIRIRELEVTAQRARQVLKSEGTPGMTLQQDHYRLSQMVQDLRKILDVKPEQIGGE
jgi:hypothetical protein